MSWGIVHVVLFSYAKCIVFFTQADSPLFLHLLPFTSTLARKPP